MSIGTGRILARREPETYGGGLPLLGRLKVGMKVKNDKGKEYPTSIDYFRATGKYAPVFHQVYGEKPSKVQLVFFSNDPKDVCSERYVVRDQAGKLLAEGDGQSWRVWSPKAADYVFVPKPGDDAVTLEKIEEIYCNEKMKGKLSIELNLSFILLKLPSVLGMWQLSTRGSKSSIPAIRSTFDRVKEMAGFVTNIPFDLLVEKVKGNRPGASTVFPVISLVPNVSQENVELLAGFMESGQKIRGLLTEAKIRALVGEVVEEEPQDVHTIAAQTVLPALPAPAEEPLDEDAQDDTPATDAEGQESLFADVEAPAEPSAEPEKVERDAGEDDPNE